MGPIFGIGLFLIAGLLAIDELIWALLPAALYFVIHLIEGEIVTPMLLARRFTLNPVLVVISLIFWFWMWGAPGAILAVPFLAISKIICDGVRPLNAIGHFLEGGRLPAICRVAATEALGRARTSSRRVHGRQVSIPHEATLVCPSWSATGRSRGHRPLALENEMAKEIGVNDRNGRVLASQVQQSSQRRQKPQGKSLQVNENSAEEPDPHPPGPPDGPRSKPNADKLHGKSLQRASIVGGSAAGQTCGRQTEPD
eukprot:gene34039-39773_t